MLLPVSSHVDTTQIRFSHDGKSAKIIFSDGTESEYYPSRYHLAEAVFEAAINGKIKPDHKTAKRLKKHCDKAKRFPAIIEAVAENKPNNILLT